MLPFTVQRDLNVAKALSGEIWHDCPMLAIELGYERGVYWKERWEGADTYTLGTSTGPYKGRYVVGGTGTGTFAHAADEPGGACRITSGATADNENNLSLGSGASFVISSDAAIGKKMWFESCWKAGDVANGASQHFVGLAEEGRGGTADGGLITDAAALADIDLIGFVQLDDDGDGLDFVYRKNGQTAQVKISVAHTLVADTYFKAGWVYDPDAPANKRIRIYINNVELSTYVTAADIAAATFPSGEELTPVIGVKTDASAAHHIEHYFGQCYQLLAA